MCPIKAVSIPSCLLILPTNPAQQFTIKRKLTAGNQIFMGNIIVYRRPGVGKICPGLGGHCTGQGSCSIELKIFTVICPRATNSVQMWRIDSSSLVRGAAPRDNAIALWSVGRKCAKPEPSQNQVTITAHTLCVLPTSDSASCDTYFMFLEANLGATLWVLFNLWVWNYLVTLNPIHILDEIVFLHYNTMDSTDIFHTLLGTATDRLGQQLILSQGRLWCCWHSGLFILLESFHISLHLI